MLLLWLWLDARGWLELPAALLEPRRGPRRLRHHPPQRAPQRRDALLLVR
jgi:hypothetical protein